MTRWLTSLFAAIIFSACQSPPRSSRGGGASSPLSAKATGIETEKVQLRRLEGSLQTRREREQYSKVLPWLETDREKIDFLSLSSLEERQNWINKKEIWSRPNSSSSRFQNIIESGDISVGMAMDHVRRSWGEPTSVEVSGNPLYQNQRWAYVKQVSGPDGFRQEKRLIYFEGGRVVGWETQ